MEVRHPRAFEKLPVMTGIEHFDPDWIWLYGSSILIAAPAHDSVILLRLIRFGEMPALWMHRLLREVSRECLKRGYRRWLTWIGDDEKELHAAAKAYRAQYEPFVGRIAVGRILCRAE